jgi:hypothetical protein
MIPGWMQLLPSLCAAAGNGFNQSLQWPQPGLTMAYDGVQRLPAASSKLTLAYNGFQPGSRPMVSSVLPTAYGMASNSGQWASTIDLNGFELLPMLSNGGQRRPWWLSMASNCFQDGFQNCLQWPLCWIPLASN